MLCRSLTVALVLCFIVLFAAPAPAKDAPPIERLLPADTMLVVGIRDVPRLRERWNSHPLNRLWEDEQVKRFFAPLRQQMEEESLEDAVRAATGRSTDELLALARGQAAFAVSDFSGLLDQFNAEGEVDPSSVPLVQVIVEVDPADHQAISDLLARGLEQAQNNAPPGVTIAEQTEDYGGHTLHTRRRTEGNEAHDGPTWVLAENLLVFSTTPESVKQTLDRWAGEGGEALADSENFRQVGEPLSDTDVFVYFNIQGLIDLMHQAMEANVDPNAAQPFTPDQLIGALGLGTLRGAYIAARLGEAHTDLDMAIHFSERRGIFKMFAFDAKADLRPAFIPAGVITASSSSFSFPQGWTAIKEMLNELNPFIAGMLVGQLQQFSAQLGVDIEKDLIGSLGGGLATAQAFREPTEPGQKPSLDHVDLIYAIGLADRARFETALNGLLAGVAQGAELFQKRDYLGVTIHTFAQPLPLDEEEETFISYAMTDRHVILSMGTTALLERVIQQMQKGGPSAWDQPEVRNALADLPEKDAVGLGYTDFAAAASGMIGMLRQMQELQFAAPDEDQWVDWEAIPDAEVAGKYLGPLAGAVYVNDEAMTLKYRLIHRQSLR